jgi:hypothetical protein
MYCHISTRKRVKIKLAKRAYIKVLYALHPILCYSIDIALLLLLLLLLHFSVVERRIAISV